MIGLPDEFALHTVSIRPLTGSGGMGTTYGPAYIAAALVTEERKLVRNAAGSEVVSSSDVYVKDHAPVGSLVTVWPGEPNAREATVLAVATWKHPRLPNYYVLALT